MAGAAVARGYLEPYLNAEYSLNTHILQHNAGEKVIEQFRKFAVYNFDVIDDSEIGKWRYQEYEKIFGPFGRWIVEDGRAAARRLGEKLWGEGFCAAIDEHACCIRASGMQVR